MDNATFHPLFQEFPRNNPKEWEKKFTTDLKGKDPGSYNWKTEDGMEFLPVYFNLPGDQKNGINIIPGQFPYMRGAGKKSTEIRQGVYVETINDAIQISKNLLNRGANSFEYISRLESKKDRFYSIGLPLEDRNEMIEFFTALENLEMKFHFRSGMFAGLLSKRIFDLYDKKQINKITGSIDFDPIGNLVRFGSSKILLKNQMKLLLAICEAQNCSDLDFNFLHVGGEIYREGGANLIQETACVLASAQEYIEFLKANGYRIDQIAGFIHFSFTIGPSYFPEIARIRAFRMLWAQILKKHGLQKPDLAMAKINARGNYFYKASYDAHTNILRNTTQAMVSILTGCDSFTSSGFYSMDESSSYHELAERISRNTQLMLRAESHLDRVQDPAGGSWYIDNMTHELGQEIWKTFQWIESRNGILSVLKTGSIQEMIRKNRKNRIDDVGNKSTMILGVNQYPNARERKHSEVESLRFKQLNNPNVVTTFKDFMKNDSSGAELYLSAMTGIIKEHVEPLETFRLAEDFEELRMQIENEYQATNKIPRVFLYTFGNSVMRRARAAFSDNFFGCIGYEIIDNPGFENIEEGLRRLEKEKFDLIVLCAADEDYVDSGALICKKILANNRENKILLAGNPENLSELMKSGLIGSIHAKSNVLLELKKFHNMIKN